MIYNPYPQVNLPFGNDNKYFLWLFEAIRNVGKHYVEYKHVSSENQYDYIPHLERVFAYELYRQWGNIIDSTGEDLVLNGEIDKTLSNDMAIYIHENNEISIDSNKNSKNITLYPDLVLHHSQADGTEQIQICEIKRNKDLNGSKILGDLYKLTCYMDNDRFKSKYKNPFKYGIFILVGGRFKDITQKIDSKTAISVKVGNDKPKSYTLEQFSADLESRLQHIICVSYDGEIIEYQKLSDLLGEIISKNNNNPNSNNF